MKINEITGDNEDAIYEKLRRIYFILNASRTTSTITADFQQLIDDSIAELYEDRQNLLKWTLSSPKISSIFEEIKTFLP